VGVLDLTGPEFLRLYVTLLVASAAVALLLRAALRFPFDEPPRGLGLDPLDVAYLTRGPDAVVDALLAGLLQREVLVCHPERRKLYTQKPLDADAHPLERAAYEAVGRGQNGLAELRRALAPALGGIAGRLQRFGLILRGPTAALPGGLPPALLFAVGALGLAKIAVGISRGRPVGFLLVLTVIAFAAGVLLAAKAPLRTGRGQRLLDRIRRDNAALEYATARDTGELHWNDLAMAVGLFGTGAFAYGPIGALHRARHPVLQQSSTGGGHSCGASCASSGCGGGGGGGGCGGCGG
jgi:uncharacterized protein (TIGR04222 family)